jgi:hypothetical protein
MKPITTRDLRQATRQDEFSKAVETANGQAEQMERKTFTLKSRHVDQINAVARELSETQRRQVNASEALRHILDEVGS